MAPAPSPPPTRGSGVEDTRRKLLLDDLVAGPESLPAPVLRMEPVTLESLPVNRGRRRLEDVEHAARHNERAAEEARRAVEEEHKRLETEAGIRRKIEREVGSLRRDVERMRESERLRVAQARYTAEREARKEVLAEAEQVVEERNRALLEIERLRTALDSDRVLMTEFSDRVRDEQQAKAKAQADADAAMDARRQAEQRLEAYTEKERLRADEELRRLEAVEAALREALAERDRLASEIVMAAEEVHGRDLSRTVAELEELVGELEGALTAERARTDNAVAHATELSEELEAARQRAQDSLRTLAQVEQLEAELEGALVAHGAALDRVRVLDEANTTTQARVDDLEADLVSSARDRDAMRVQLDGQRDEIESLEAANADLRAAAEAAPRERAAASKQVANDRVRDLERLLDIAEAEHDSLMQEVCDLRNAAAASPAPGAGGPDDGVVAELRTQLSELRAARDAFAVQVRELESAVTISSLHREEESQRAEQLERALSQEQSRIREVEEELRRLRSSTHVDARAGATGRAEPAVPEGEPAPEPEPEQPEPAEAPEASAHVERRSALAELSGLASFGGNEGYRRR